MTERHRVPATWQRSRVISDLHVVTSAAQRLVAATLLVPLAPFLLAIAAAIRAFDGPEVVFRQRRLGRAGTPFIILKYRTMVREADTLLGSAADDGPRASRLTRTGPFLRRTGLDELPQLVNIVRGEMSFVGPRAVLPEVGRHIPVRYQARFDVRPGVTGLAQVSGRNELPWSQRLALDAHYGERRSVWLDARILGRTARTVVTGSGHVSDRNTAEVDDLGLLRGGLGGPR